MSDPTRIDLISPEVLSDPFRRPMEGVARHGHTPFKTTFISHIEDNLFVGGCENGMVLPRIIRHVVSLYPWENYTVESPDQLDSYLEVKMYDSEQGFDPVQVREVASWAAKRIKQGPTLIHCQAGINRSNLVAATALVMLGRSPEGAVALLREKRDAAVLCNLTFERFVLGLWEDV